MSINRNVTTAVLLTAVAIAAITGGLLLTTYAEQTNSTTSMNTNGITIGNMTMPSEDWGRMRFDRHGCKGGFAPVEISAEYEANITNTAKNDTDVQNLLAQSYNITAIRPMVKSVVDGNGYVTTKVTTAVVLLEKGTSGYASVLVDLEQGKVTEIVITSRTVIQK